MANKANLKTVRFFLNAQKKGNLEEYYGTVKELNDLINFDHTFSLRLDDINAKPEEKKALIFDKNKDLNENVIDDLLNENALAPFENPISSLVHSFLVAYYSSRGYSFGCVYSIKPLDEKDINDLQAAFTKKIENDVVLENKIDPDLIGGVKVVIDQQTWDGSYKNKVEQLRHSLSDQKQSLSPKEIPDLMLRSLDDFKSENITIKTPNSAGIVESVADGILHIKGANYAMSSEILQVGKSSSAMVMDLKEDEIAAVLLQENEPITSGVSVSLTGRVVEVPVGDGLLGRVVNALGKPIDGKGPVKASGYLPIEAEAPGIIERSAVDEPLQTGIKIIDTIIPIGKGQRELIIGDRQTGKTAIGIDTIINQKGKNVKCVYVAIGQKNSSLAQIIDKLNKYGAMDYTCVVNAPASDLVALQYIAPYSGCAIGEYWMRKGEDVLVVYDDLSKHAIAYRTISLLLRRPPGREAYPGDIFYLHSRLLERAGKLSKELGSGSLTALPIIETQAGDISAYIPTNVISITDGQIFLESDAFNSGIRPAIDYGLSVSRVGGSAQRKAMRKVAGSLKLDLSQYQEVLSFAQFGSDLDAATQNTINHGKHLVELLKQDQYHPLSMAQMVVLLYANKLNMVDSIKLERIKDYEEELLALMDSRFSSVLKQIEIKGDLDHQIEEELTEIITRFSEDFKIKR